MTTLCIPLKQARAHVRWELAAVFLVAPLLVYIGLTQSQLPTWQRVALLGTAAGTLLIDGSLLVDWQKQGQL